MKYSISDNETIDIFRSMALSAIDEAANWFIVNIASSYNGINMVLHAQQIEAVRLTIPGAAAPTVENYPLLASLIGLAGSDVTECAAHVLAVADGWAAAVGPINAMRLVSKAQVSAAGSVQDIKGILDGIVWR